MANQGFFFNDSLIGEEIYYYEYGGLESYILYKPSGEVSYGILYDDKGNKKKEIGGVNCFLAIDDDDFNYELGDTLKFDVYAPQPPHLKLDLNLQIIAKDGPKVTYDSMKPLVNGMYRSSEILRDTGFFYLKATLFVEHCGSKETDTIEKGFNFYVDLKD